MKFSWEWFLFYTWLLEALREGYEEIRLLKESPRGSVRLIRHKEAPVEKAGRRETGPGGGALHPGEPGETVSTYSPADGSPLKKEGVCFGKKCPRCGTEPHENAAFCPYCAESINERAVQEPPKPRPVKAIRAAAALAVAAVIALGIWLYIRPKTYDAGETAELLYIDSDGTCQVLFNVSGDRFTPLYWVDIPVREDHDFRTNIRLYVTHAESGTHGYH